MGDAADYDFAEDHDAVQAFIEAGANGDGSYGLNKELPVEPGDMSIPHVGMVRDLRPKHETSHTETWEITFRATVPAGLAARGALTTAEGIIRQRMTEVLNQAGVVDPRVQARKMGRSTHRGDWEGGVEYEPGETVFEAGKLWVANKRSQNRPPHSNHGGIVDYWAETSRVFLADELFAPPKALPRQTLVRETNPSGDEILAVAEVDDEGGVQQWRPVGEVRWRSGKPPSSAERYETRVKPIEALQELADNDIEDAEIVEET